MPAFLLDDPTPPDRRRRWAELDPAARGACCDNDARNLHALRAAAHAPGALLLVPGADHFSILTEFRCPNRLLVRAAQDLLGQGLLGQDLLGGFR